MEKDFRMDSFGTLSQNVTFHRERLALSQAQLAELSGITYKTIRNVESARGGITLRSMDAIAQALRIPTMKLLESR